jgi:hypothetical protein
MMNVSSDAIARGALGPPKRTAGAGGFRSPAVSQAVRCAAGASAGDSARLRAALRSASVVHLPDWGKCQEGWFRRVPATFSATAGNGQEREARAT